MAKYNPLVEHFLNENKTQSQKAASTNIGRSIDSQKDAWDKALADEPSTFKTWNPDVDSTPQKTNPLLSFTDSWKQQQEQKKAEAEQPKKKGWFASLIENANKQSEENPWSYDATNNIIDTTVPEKKEEPKEEVKQERKPLEYSDAFLKQEEQKDAWSPNWTNDTLKSNFGEWISNVTKGAGEGTLASLTGAERLLYESGQKARTAQYEEDIQQLQTDYERALTAYEQDKADGMSEADLQADLNTINAIKTKLDAYNKVVDEGVQQEATKATSELSNQLQEESSKYVDYAKEALGNTGLGNFVTDVAVNALQMAGDAAMNLVAPGTSLATMGLRTAGSAGQEAEAQGASLAQQLGYATVKGGIEMATEMMFDGLAGAYGKGTADDVVEELIRRMTKSGNETERTALRMLFSGLGEAVEEGVSGAADPLAKTILEGIQSLPKNYNKDLAVETLYSMLVGFAMGGGGGAVNIVTGGNAQSNAELAETDAIQAQLEADGIGSKSAQQVAPIVKKENSGEQLTRKEKNILAEILNRQDVEAGSNETATSEVSPTVPQSAPQATTGVSQTKAAQIQTGLDTAQQITAHSEAIEQLQSLPESEGRDAAIDEHLREIARLERQGEEAQPGRPGGTYGNEAKEESNPIVNSITNKEESSKPDTTSKKAQLETELDKADQNQPKDYMKPYESDVASGKIPEWVARNSAKFDELYDRVKSFLDSLPYEYGADADQIYDMIDGDSYTGEMPSDALFYISKAVKDGVANDIETAYELMRDILERVDANEQSRWTDENNGRVEDRGFYEWLEEHPISESEESTDIENPLIQQEESHATAPTTNEVEQENAPVEQETETAPRAEEETTQAEEQTAEPTESEQQKVSEERATEIGNEINQHLEAINNLNTMPESEGRNSAIQEHSDAINALLAELNGTNANNQSTEANTNTGIPPVGQPGKKAPKVSKTSTNSMRNTAEQVGGTQEALYYMPKSEQESLNNAMARADADMVSEMQSLAAKEQWSGEDGDTAFVIFRKLMVDAVHSGDRTAVDAWGKILQNHKTENARALQATAKWARTGAAAAMVASSDIDANNNLTAQQKADLKNTVYEAAQRFDGIGEDDLGSLRKLILDLNEARNTGTFGANNFEKILNKINNFDYLKEFALRQLMALPNDSTNTADIGQQLKTWQVNAQLSRLGTFFRNLFGNASFDVVDTFAQDAFGFAIDSAISKLTGRKEVGIDKGWLSKNARSSAMDALNKAILEIAADVDMSGDASKYGTTSNRTNKMTGGAFERFMSRWEQLLGYSLNASDKFFRGQIQQSYAEGLKGLSEADANALAQAVADYRLFQNQGAAASISKGLHNLLNFAGVGGEVSRSGRTGGFGLGDLVNPYPGVPANLAVKALEYSPANIIKGGIEIVKLLKDAKMGEQVTGQQMQAAMDMARGIAGVPIIMLFTALAKTKLFKNSDDEKDYDVSAENTAQGLSGVQWNLDATLRALDGEKAEWKDGDQLMKVSWLEPLNAFMSIASMIADENEDKTLDTYISNYLKGALVAAMDMPVMENIQNVVNTIKYADSDDIFKTAKEAGSQLLGDAAGGMIPAPVSQLARVTDNYVRDTKGDTKAETAFNAFLNNIPGLRNQLPAKTGNFGNARLNEPNQLLRTLNSFVLPGAINTFQETAVQDEISRLYESSGDVALYPDRNGPKSLEFSGEKYNLTADEQRAYHELAGSKSEEYVNGLLNSSYYDGLTDEQKRKAIKEAYSLAKDAAKTDYAKSHDINYDSRSTLLAGVDKPGTSDDRTALKESSLPDYIAFKTGFDDGVKSSDYATIDKYVKQYNSLPANLRTVISERDDDFRAIKKFADIGVKSENYYKYKNSLSGTQADLDKNGTASGNAKLMALANSGLSESECKKIITGLKKNDGNYDFGSNAVAAYNALSGYGMSTKQTSDFFNAALTCKYRDGKQVDQGGTLSADSVAYALSKMKNLSDKDRSKIFNDIKSQVSNYYNDWKDYTYSSEIRYINSGRSKYTYSSSNPSNKSGKENELLKILAGG